MTNVTTSSRLATGGLETVRGGFHHSSTQVIRETGAVFPAEPEDAPHKRGRDMATVDRVPKVTSQERDRAQWTTVPLAEKKRQRGHEPGRKEAGREVETVSAREEAIDAALEMTFPASDPPAWTP